MGVSWRCVMVTADLLVLGAVERLVRCFDELLIQALSAERVATFWK